ncbi:hypothetical protein [Arthrobacter sp. lap29]|uniref:hypothetical protein n=1 Tax=Arthrobacter sp. lap29 TaxID=3056122 RepID=UPI0028F7219B|nr:hypothetical protein [Arthrobacter sp. lap29]
MPLRIHVLDLSVYKEIIFDSVGQKEDQDGELQFTKVRDGEEGTPLPKYQVNLLFRETDRKNEKMNPISVGITGDGKTVPGAGLTFGDLVTLKNLRPGHFLSESGTKAKIIDYYLADSVSAATPVAPVAPVAAPATAPRTAPTTAPTRSRASE